MLYQPLAPGSTLCRALAVYENLMQPRIEDVRDNFCVGEWRTPVVLSTPRELVGPIGSGLGWHGSSACP